VRRCLVNYRKLKAALEKICEVNQQLLRGEKTEAKTRRSKGLISGVPVSAASAKDSSRKKLPASGNLGCAGPTKCWKMNSSSRRFTRLS
jgi:hypothetical protein